jgi:dephospho-CoA kinase
MDPSPTASRDASPHAPPLPTPPSGRKPVIGLAGGIGSGKSFVARLFAGLGCAVIDADQLAKAALDDPQVVRTLAQWWGPDVIGPDGRADRKRIGAIVFNDRAELDRLEQLIHPRVHAGREALRRQHQADPNVKAIVEDCPLLFEKNIDRSCDVVVFVQASRQARLERVARTRGWTAEQLDAREKNQLPLDTKARRADDVVSNEADEAEVLAHVRRVLSKILQGTS